MRRQRCCAGALYPDNIPARIFVTHTRPEPLPACCNPCTPAPTLWRWASSIRVARSTPPACSLSIVALGAHWAEVVRLLGLVGEELPESEEWEALAGKCSPRRLCSRAKR